MHSGGMTWVPGSGSNCAPVPLRLVILKVRKQVWYEGLYASVSVARTSGNARLPLTGSPEPLAMLAPRRPCVEELNPFLFVKVLAFKDPHFRHEGVAPHS